MCEQIYEKGFLALPLIDSDFLWSSMNNITIFQLAINRVEEKLKITMCGDAVPYLKMYLIHFVLTIVQSATTTPLHNFFKMPHFDFHNKSQEHLKEMDKCHNSCVGLLV